MGKKIDIYKLTLDFLKGNKVFMYVVVALMTGGTAGYKLPSLFSAAPVEVTVNVPENNEAKNLQDEIKNLERVLKELKLDIKKLKQWHGGR